MARVYISKAGGGTVYDSANAKKVFISSVRAGFSVAQALKACNKAESTYAYWRKTDPDFRKLVEEVRATAAQRRGSNAEEIPEFPEFSEKYLDTKLFRHQLQWYDLLEGRDPRELHPAQTYIKAEPDMVLINTPPEHAKSLDLHTELPTPYGWTTIGDLRVGDQVFGPDGKPTTVVGKSEVFDKPCSKVSFNHGETFTASDDHLWTVIRPRTRHEVTVTTRELRPGDRLPFQAELHMDAAQFDLDPYLLGCWLGDGHTASGRFTSADPEIVNAFAAYEPRLYAKYGYETTGLFRQLAELGLIGRKRVPAGYQFGSAEQRLALLQGLMDTDGTISVAGQASFTSTNHDLAQGVLYLASSLGLRPSIREGVATCNGKDCGLKWTVHFSPCGKPVFRLARKLRRVRPVPEGRHTTAVMRRVTAIEPAERVPTQCIRVDNDSHLFLVGRGLVPTHNSTTVTVNYVTWRICQDPNIRVLIVSKTQDMAKKFLLSIKERLAESDSYYELQTKFGPPGGFAEGSASWTADRIYVAGRESGEKDPTVQALGIKGHIYGSRADLVIMDDCVDHTNHGDYVKQIDWLQNMVMSRVADAGGKMVIVGTRIETTDLYSEILKSDYYGEEESPWTYLTQPAVLEYGEDRDSHVTLWPYTNRAPVSIQGRKLLEREGWPREGLWPMWTAQALSRKRSRMTPRNWSLVYQQEQVADDQVFATKDVTGCIDEQRYAGRLVPGLSGHRQYGMEGLFIVAGLDPADVGNTAAVVVGLDRQTGVRWVLDVFNRRGTRPHELRELIRSWTDKYRIAEWRIEKNAFQGSILRDEELKTYLYGRGCVMAGHFTGSNKFDSNYGVASMATLFHGSATKQNLIRLPTRFQSEGTRSLVENLCTWNPIPANTRAHSQTGHWDALMALWFAEIRCREMMQGEYSDFHLSSEFASERDTEGQIVIDVDFALAQGGIMPWDGRGW